MPNQTTPRSRCILELLPDGTIVMETYANGARCQEILDRGFEMPYIRMTLRAQQERIAADIARKAELREASANALHSRVYWHAANAKGQGREFADRVIGRPAQAPKAPKAPAGPTVAASADLV